MYQQSLHQIPIPIDTRNNAVPNSQPHAQQVALLLLGTASAQRTPSSGAIKVAYPLFSATVENDNLIIQRHSGQHELQISTPIRDLEYVMQHEPRLLPLFRALLKPLVHSEVIVPRTNYAYKVAKYCAAHNIKPVNSLPYVNTFARTIHAHLLAPTLLHADILSTDTHRATDRHIHTAARATRLHALFLSVTRAHVHQTMTFAVLSCATDDQIHTAATPAPAHTAAVCRTLASATLLAVYCRSLHETIANQTEEQVTLASMIVAAAHTQSRLLLLGLRQAALAQTSANALLATLSCATDQQTHRATLQHADIDAVCRALAGATLTSLYSGYVHDVLAQHTQSRVASTSAVARQFGEGRLLVLGLRQAALAQTLANALLDTLSCATDQQTHRATLQHADIDAIRRALAGASLTSLYRGYAHEALVQSTQVQVSSKSALDRQFGQERLLLLGLRQATLAQTTTKALFVVLSCATNQQIHRRDTLQPADTHTDAICRALTATTCMSLYGGYAHEALVQSTQVQVTSTSAVDRQFGQERLLLLGLCQATLAQTLAITLFATLSCATDQQTHRHTVLARADAHADSLHRALAGASLASLYSGYAHLTIAKCTEEQVTNTSILVAAADRQSDTSRLLLLGLRQVALAQTLVNALLATISCATDEQIHRAHALHRHSSLERADAIHRALAGASLASLYSGYAHLTIAKCTEEQVTNASILVTAADHQSDAARLLLLGLRQVTLAQTLANALLDTISRAALMSVYSGYVHATLAKCTEERVTNASILVAAADHQSDGVCLGLQEGTLAHVYAAGLSQGMCAQTEQHAIARLCMSNWKQIDTNLQTVTRSQVSALRIRDSLLQTAEQDAQTAQLFRALMYLLCRSLNEAYVSTLNRLQIYRSLILALQLQANASRISDDLVNCIRLVIQQQTVGGVMSAYMHAPVRLHSALVGTNSGVIGNQLIAHTLASTLATSMYQGILTPIVSVDIALPAFKRGKTDATVNGDSVQNIFSRHVGSNVVDIIKTIKPSDISPIHVPSKVTQRFEKICDMIFQNTDTFLNQIIPDGQSIVSHAYKNPLVTSYYQSTTAKHMYMTLYQHIKKNDAKTAYNRVLSVRNLMWNASKSEIESKRNVLRLYMILMIHNVFVLQYKQLKTTLPASIAPNNLPSQCRDDAISGMRGLIKSEYNQYINDKNGINENLGTTPIHDPDRFTINAIGTAIRCVDFMWCTSASRMLASCNPVKNSTHGVSMLVQMLAAYYLLKHMPANRPGGAAISQVELRTEMKTIHQALYDIVARCDAQTPALMMEQVNERMDALVQKIQIKNNLTKDDVCIQLLLHLQKQTTTCVVGYNTALAQSIHNNNILIYHEPLIDTTQPTPTLANDSALTIKCMDNVILALIVLRYINESERRNPATVCKRCIETSRNCKYQHVYYPVN